MAYDTTILNGDIGVWYFANNRAKMLTWEGSATDFYTMNELYSAMATLLDEADTIDDGSCFSAETPVEYTTGKIDQGDADPWFIQYEVMEHITGGALRTNGWTRATGTNTGIVMVEVSSSTIVAADVGNDITNPTTSDAGTLLEVLTGPTNDYLLIRPDSSAAANDFDGTTGTFSCNGNTASTIEAGATTGEQIWANVYSIGTIDENVHIYLYQGTRLTTDSSARLYSWINGAKDWYENGHIDTTVALKDMTQSTWAIIDDGYVRAFARKPGDLYASFEVANSITSGGRNPIPLQTESDINQGHGIKKISTGSWSGTFVDGEVLTGGTNAYRAILDLDNSTVDTELVYFPIAKVAPGGETGAFVSSEVISGASASATASSSESDDGPADSGWFTGTGVPVVSFGNTTEDIDNDGSDEYYGITIDCNQNTLAEVYQWIKYICGNGQGTGDELETALNDINGEEYQGATAYFTYSAISGTIAEGESVTQQTTGATGVILSHDTTNDIVLLRSTRGSFNGSNQIDADDDSDYFTPSAAGNFAAKTASPLGTYAGGVYFGARGVLISDYKSADENSFILTDIGGTTRERPISIVLEVTNLASSAITDGQADLVTIYQLTGAGGSIDKTEMLCDGGEVAGDTTIAVDAIGDQVPATGRVVLVDVDDQNSEYVMRYSSYDSGTDTFTLANQASTATSGTTTTQLVDSGGSFSSTVQRGDMVYHSSGVAYVVTVDDNTTLQLDRAISGLASGQAYEINCVPITISASDYLYAALMHRFSTTDPEQVSIVYPGSTMYFRVKVRNTREDDLVNGPIKPFSSDGSTSGTDQSVQVVRTIDTIIS